MGQTSRSRKRSPKSASMESRENYLTNLAMDLAERKLLDGTASSQVITHFLKLGTLREEYELERLRGDIELSKAKVKKIESDENTKDIYEQALAAFRRYSGQTEEYEEDYYEDY